MSIFVFLLCDMHAIWITSDWLMLYIVVDMICKRNGSLNHKESLFPLQTDWINVRGVLHSTEHTYNSIHIHSDIPMTNILFFMSCHLLFDTRYVYSLSLSVFLSFSLFFSLSFSLEMPLCTLALTVYSIEITKIEEKL